MGDGNRVDGGVGGRGLVYWIVPVAFVGGRLSVHGDVLLWRHVVWACGVFLGVFGKTARTDLQKK